VECGTAGDAAATVLVGDGRTATGPRSAISLDESALMEPDERSLAVELLRYFPQRLSHSLESHSDAS
jgi:hypothetical protein